MRQSLGIILMILLCVNCSRSDNPELTNTQKRFLWGYSNDSLNIRTEYRLTKTVLDSVIKFDYFSQSDSSRNFKIEFKKYSNELILIHSDYKKTEINRFHNNRISTRHFDIYTFIEPQIDGMSPVLFNEAYGVLAIGNPLGPSAIFLRAKEESELIEEILNELY